MAFSLVAKPLFVSPDGQHTKRDSPSSLEARSPSSEGLKQYLVISKDPADTTSTAKTYAFLQSVITKKNDLWYDTAYPNDIRFWLVNATDTQNKKIKTDAGVASTQENFNTGESYTAVPMPSVASD